MMIRWIFLFILACFSSASYATCSSGGVEYAPPLYVDLSDKINVTNPTWFATFATQYTGSFNCSTDNSKFGYTQVLSTDNTYATILGFNDNKHKVRAEIIDAPEGKYYVDRGNHNASELNTQFTVRFTLVDGNGQAITGDTAQLGDVLFVSDLSGMSVWEVITWPLDQMVKIVQWLFNGFKWPYDSRDMFGQPMTIKYAPKPTTCSFNNDGLTVKLPTMGVQQVTHAKGQPGLTPFTLNFTCQNITALRTTDRMIEVFMSSNNLLSTDETVLVDNSSSGAKGIGLRLIKRDDPQSPVLMSTSTTERGSATALYHLPAGALASGSFAIPMAVYYYAWRPYDASQGTLNTSAMLNIIYP